MNLASTSVSATVTRNPFSSMQTTPRRGIQVFNPYYMIPTVEALGYDNWDEFNAGDEFIKDT